MPLLDGTCGNGGPMSERKRDETGGDLDADERSEQQPGNDHGGQYGSQESDHETGGSRRDVIENDSTPDSDGAA